MIAFANAKINLGLYITSKRDDGFHNIATCFYPIPLRDAVEIIETNKSEFSLSVEGLETDTSSLENLCTRAFQLLKKDYSSLQNVQMYLLKNIPIGAGLGGGSSDAAFTLKLINKKFQLNISDKKLMQYALQLGSDCPFFIRNKPCIATGRGEILEEIDLDLSKYFLVLINPKIHINTAWAYQQINAREIHFFLKDILQQPIENWKNILYNDFEEAVFNKYSEIKSIKEKLYNQGAIYASMSGSGSSVYGLFRENVSKESLGFDKNYFQFFYSL